MYTNDSINGTSDKHCGRIIAKSILVSKAPTRCYPSGGSRTFPIENRMNSLMFLGYNSEASTSRTAQDHGSYNDHQ